MMLLNTWVKEDKLIKLKLTNSLLLLIKMEMEKLLNQNYLKSSKESSMENDSQRTDDFISKFNKNPFS